MLKLNNVYFKINNKIILDGLNLHIKSNEIHSLLGVNGTGKSTLAYLLMGANGYKPQSGDIILYGKKINTLSITKRANLGITLQWQHPASFEGITVRDYLKLKNKSLKITDLKQSLNCVGLKPEIYLNRFVDSTLSGGERKRIELASLILLPQKLVILDEPDSGIDAISINIIIKVIQKFKENGKSVLLITHRKEIAEISDRISLVNKGKVIMTDIPSKVNTYFEKNFAQENNS